MGCSDQSLRGALFCLIAVLDAGPTPFEVFTLLIIPLGVAVTTTFIAFASWRTASKATTISEAALRAEHDRARDELAISEAARREEYAARLDSNFVAFFEASGQYSHEMDRWIDEASELEIHWHGPLDDAPYPPLPSRALLDARLQATMLHARGDDRMVLGTIDGYVRAVIRSSARWKLSNRMDFLVDLIRKWRDGSIRSEVFMSRLQRKRRTVDANLDNPPRRVS